MTWVIAAVGISRPKTAASLTSRHFRSDTKQHIVPGNDQSNTSPFPISIPIPNTALHLEPLHDLSEFLDLSDGVSEQGAALFSVFVLTICLGPDGREGKSSPHVHVHVLALNVLFHYSMCCHFSHFTMEECRFTRYH